MIDGYSQARNELSTLSVHSRTPVTPLDTNADHLGHPAIELRVSAGRVEELESAILSAELDAKFHVRAEVSPHEVAPYQPSGGLHIDWPEDRELAAALLTAFAGTQAERERLLRHVAQLELDLSCLRREFLEVNESLLTVGNFLQMDFQSPRPETVHGTFAGVASNSQRVTRTWIINGRTAGLAGFAIHMDPAVAIQEVRLVGEETGLTWGTWFPGPAEFAHSTVFSLGRSLRAGDASLRIEITGLMDGTVDQGEASGPATGVPTGRDTDIVLFRWPPGMHLPRDWGVGPAFREEVDLLNPSLMTVDLTAWSATFMRLTRGANRLGSRSKTLIGPLDHSFVTGTDQTEIQVHPPVDGLGCATLTPPTDRPGGYQFLARVANDLGPEVRVSLHACTRDLVRKMKSGLELSGITELEVITREHELGMTVKPTQNPGVILEVHPGTDKPAILALTSTVDSESNAFAWLRISWVDQR